MNKLVLIGGGFITQFYQKGIQNSKNIQLVGIADINENCIAHQKVFPYVPFYQDYTKMLTELQPDIIHICVGVKDHFRLLKGVLERGFCATIEKPLCLSLKETEQLYYIAKKNHVYFNVVYHFMFGDEITFLKEHISEFGKIKRWSFNAHELYAYNENHIVMEEKRSLENAWIDVASNLFSDIALFVDITNLKKTREFLDIDSTSQIVRYAHKTFENEEDIELDLLADWMTSGKEKISVIDTERGRLFIDHHEQIIYFNGQCIYKNIPEIHRMYNQYENYWKHFQFDSNNEKLTRDIQKAIFL